MIRIKYYSIYLFPVEIETRKDENDVMAAVVVKRDATVVGVQGAELLTRRGPIIAAAVVDPIQVGTHTHDVFSFRKLVPRQERNCVQ